MSYLDIPCLYKEQEILLFKECYALEKIHGSSSHLTWNNGKINFFAGGENHERFVALFDHENLIKVFTERIGAEKCIVFGEVYGGKCQGMSQTYGEELKFIVFDVKIVECWLNVPNAEDVAKHLGLEFVYYEKITTDLKTIDAQRDADSVQAIRNGMGPGKKREGIVLRPLIEMRKNNNERIIAKHKREEFQERQHQPKVVDPERFIILENAQAIADEWVVPMRLEHILQELPNAKGMEETREVIAAMIADIYKEARGEIVESKEVATAIGKKTAKLWKDRIERQFREKNLGTS